MFPDFIDACGYNDPEDESKVRAPAWFPAHFSPFSRSAHETASIGYPARIVQVSFPLLLNGPISVLRQALGVVSCSAVVEAESLALFAYLQCV